MYVITDKRNVAICVSESLDHQSNGNPLVHNGMLAIAAIIVGHEYSDVSDIPGDYTDQKYLYDGTNWSENSDYFVPVDEKMEANQLRADVDYIAIMTGVEL